MPYGDATSGEIERVAAEIVDAAYKVHRALGPGLLESSYEMLLIYELRKRGLKVLDQVLVPIVYDGITFDTDYRLDLLVEDLIVVEVKAVELMHAVYQAQVMTYLKITHKRLGLLINFNVVHFKDAVKRIIL